LLAPRRLSTPLKKHKAWLQHDIPQGARAAAGRRILNSQAIKNARKKAKREENQESQPKNLSVYAHCMRAFTRASQGANCTLQESVPS